MALVEDNLIMKVKCNASGKVLELTFDYVLGTGLLVKSYPASPAKQVRKVLSKEEYDENSWILRMGVKEGRLTAV